MPSLKNPVLTLESIKKLYLRFDDVKEMPSKEEKEIDNLEQAISFLKATALTYVEGKRGVASARKDLKDMTVLIERIITILEVINEYKAASKLNTISKKCNLLKSEIKNNLIKKVSELKSKFKDIYDRLDIDLNSNNYLDEEAGNFKDLKAVEIKVTNSATVIYAPVLITTKGRIRESVIEKFKSEGMERILNYLLIRNARLLVIRKEGRESRNRLIDRIDNLCETISQRSSGIIPIHPISLETSDYYLTLLLPNKIASLSADITNKMNTFHIYVEE